MTDRTSSPISKAYAALDPSPAGDSRDALIQRLMKALSGFAEAADIFEREYGDKMQPDTGCNIKFSALCEARAVLTAVKEIKMTEKFELTKEDGKAICAFFQEFFQRGELSDEENLLYFRVIAAGDFGRPVPDHASGGGISE